MTDRKQPAQGEDKDKDKDKGTDAPEVEAHGANVLDAQGISQPGAASDENTCVSIASFGDIK
jgi:hypothetical protein